MLLINSPLPKNIPLFSRPWPLRRSLPKSPVHSRSAGKLVTSGLADTASSGWVGGPVPPPTPVGQCHCGGLGRTVTPAPPQASALGAA